MLDDYGFEIYEENALPLAYLITFRTYGTWLHGDERSSQNRSRRGVDGTVRLDPNIPLEEKMLEEMVQPPMIFNLPQRTAVDEAIKMLCSDRKYPSSVERQEQSCSFRGYGKC